MPTGTNKGPPLFIIWCIAFKGVLLKKKKKKKKPRKVLLPPGLSSFSECSFYGKLIGFLLPFSLHRFPSCLLTLVTVFILSFLPNPND